MVPVGGPSSTGAGSASASSQCSAASGDIPLTSGGGSTGSGGGGGSAGSGVVVVVPVGGPSSTGAGSGSGGGGSTGSGGGAVVVVVGGAEGGSGAGVGECAGVGSGAGADSSQRSAASGDMPRTSGVGGATVEPPPPHAQMLVAQAAEAANGTVRAVPNTAAPTSPGRERIRSMTSSVASREPIAADCEIPRASPPETSDPAHQLGVVRVGQELRGLARPEPAQLVGLVVRLEAGVVLHVHQPVADQLWAALVVAVANRV